MNVFEIPCFLYYWIGYSKLDRKNIFKDSKNNYGTRKIKIGLFKLKYIVLRRKISKNYRARKNSRDELFI